jgi:hypothetical protein
MNLEPAAQRPKLPNLDADRVAPKLWVGAYPRPGGHSGLHPLPLPAATEAVRAAGVSAWVRVAWELAPHFRIDDADPPQPGTFELAAEATEVVDRYLRRGHRVLVTCNLGQNRSGLVVGLALVRSFGLGGAEAVARVREARGPRALSNRAFAEWLASQRPR